MIPVTPQLEPAIFEAKVRARGKAWLENRGFTHGTLPPTVKPPSYWRECREDFLRAYGWKCAYLAVQLNKTDGDVDHFLPKSRYAQAIYEWSNYRLASSRINQAKNNFDDILDPFLIAQGTFRLGPSLDIYPGEHLTGQDRDDAQRTIDRLRLNAPDRKSVRSEHWDEYLNGEIDAAYLRKRSPFVASEMERLGLLDPTVTGLRS